MLRGDVDTGAPWRGTRDASWPPLDQAQARGGYDPSALPGPTAFRGRATPERELSRLRNTAHGAARSAGPLLIVANAGMLLYDLDLILRALVR